MTAAALARPRPSHLRGHGEAAARALAFLVLGLPLGALYLLTLPAAAAIGPETFRRPLAIERTLLNRLLGARIPAPASEAPTWRAVALPAARLPLALLGLAAAAVPLLPAAYLAAQAAGSLAAGGDRYLGPWALDAPFAAAVIVFLLPALVVSAAALEASGAAARRLARRAIRTSPAGAVRDALAESLGDGTLAIAYWLPDRAIFVDEHGAPVTLPEPASGRSWTAVEHGGRRVAAIVHDAELEARPELVQAAASGAVLALENEQLKADLRARVAELRSSRKRLVQASVDARRKLERDLHDGAQQQLVALSLDLQLLKARVADEELRRSIDASAARLADALAELRELARGIHPAILTERGLAPSLEALAGRVPLPVELDLRLDGRLPAPVEAAAYFVVAEALTNVAKYAEAGSAVVSLRRAGDLLEVEIADDGVGGADPERGSGLRGLADRLGAVDGTLSVESPPGAGTRVLARVPCAGSEDA